MNIEIVYLKKETENYSLKFRKNRKTGENELILRSKSGGSHFAAHKRYNILDDMGNILSSEPIDRPVAQFIIDNFEVRGDTESFNIYQTDLNAGKLASRSVPIVSPADVRHKLTMTESSFTATGEKLNHHWPIFEKYRDTGYGSIIRATMTLHQVCSSHCHYCSTIARNKKDSISLEEAKHFVSNLYIDQAEFNKVRFSKYNDQYRKISGTDIRLKGLILSGGGQPNLWPHFEEFVEWLTEMDIELGLITNGFPERIDEKIYKKFKWIRISITPEDASPHYREGKFNNQYIPEIIKNSKNTTVGYSYVYGPWTDDDVLSRIVQSIADNNFQYCRLLTDCNLSRSAQLKSHQSLAERLISLGILDPTGQPLKKIFHQLKYHGEQAEANTLWRDGQCYLQIYNVFWDTTGHEDNGESFCYACDSITVLAEEQNKENQKNSERRFNHSKWGLVSNKNISDLYEKPVRPYFDPRETCSACLFMKNNGVVKSLVSRDEYSSLKLNDILEHINFP